MSTMDIICMWTGRVVLLSGGAALVVLIVDASLTFAIRRTVSMATVLTWAMAGRREKKIAEGT